MQERTLVFNSDGSMRFLAHDELTCLEQSGSTAKRRASHVEPKRLVLRVAFHMLRRMFGESGTVAAFTRVWPCEWVVDLRPSNGPRLDGPFADRATAIEAEERWLSENYL